MPRRSLPTESIVPITKKNSSTPTPARRCQPLALVAIGLAGLASVPAQAQTPSPLPEWQYSVGVPLRKLFAPDIPEWEVRIGLAARIAPRYEGASDYYALGGP